jgi:hypothetical protein
MKFHKKSHKLSSKQQLAVDLLLQGKTDQEAASAVEVTRETVNRWRNRNPYFQAVLNRRRKELWEGAHERMRCLVNKAVETLENSLDEGNLRAAVEILKGLGIYGKVEPPQGPVDPELVMWREAQEWARTELARRGPSENQHIDFLTQERSLIKLTRQRMDELLIEHGLSAQS